ncbi:MAG: hypothetical protein IKT31_05195 [Firmicutes bacterium]|nr:hypothetical protein [Bacillota bacterium]
MIIENVILFYGCDSQVGTTMTALSAAELLAEKGKNVLYISAGSIPGIAFSAAEPAGAAADLWDRTEDEEEIRQLAVKHRGADILQGVQSWMNGGNYLKGLLSELCSTCSRMWDYVIVDGGSSGESSMGQEALDFAGMIFLVLTQQEKSLHRWKMRREWVENRMKVKPYFVVNKFVGNGTFYKESQLKKMLPCEEDRLSTIPYLPYGWQAELERCTLMKYRPFRKAMEKIAVLIEDEKEKKIETSEG